MTRDADDATTATLLPLGEQTERVSHAMLLRRLRQQGTINATLLNLLRFVARQTIRSRHSFLASARCLACFEDSRASRGCGEHSKAGETETQLLLLLLDGKQA